MRSHARIALSFVFRIAVTVCMFLLLFRPQVFGLRTDAFGGVTPQTMWDHLQETDLAALLPWMVAACAVKLSGIMLAVTRWKYTLEGQGIRVPFALLVRWWFTGRFLGVLVPNWLGLDAYRLFHTSRFTGGVVHPLIAIVAEKVIGFGVLALLVLITVPFIALQPEIDHWMLLVVAVGAALATTASAWMLFAPRTMQTLLMRIPTPGPVRRFSRRFGDAVARYEGHRTLLIKALAVGFLSHLCTIGMYLCTIMAVREGMVSLIEMLAALPVLVGGVMLGPSLFGEGIREVLFAAILGDGNTTAAVLYTHLAWWVGEVLPFLLGAPLFVLTIPSKTTRRATDDHRPSC